MLDDAQLVVLRALKLIVPYPAPLVTVQQLCNYVLGVDPMFQSLDVGLLVNLYYYKPCTLRGSVARMSSARLFGQYKICLAAIIEFLNNNDLQATSNEKVQESISSLERAQKKRSAAKLAQTQETNKKISQALAPVEKGK